ncbi:MAG: hypothetical protein GY696_37220 [Gammaproteobacteria bacterium]|nr:hypothetical protein [Gammaproteobacteria bacterium]
MQPWKDDPFLQLSEDQQWQQTPNSARNKWKFRKTVILSYIMASCIVILLMLSGTHGYNVDCWSPTRMERFARPTTCDVLLAAEEQPLGKTFEVLTKATTREISGWSCELIT